jgi:DNA-binding MarR family transcriptional regulator
MTALYDKALEPLGINVAQFALLRKISRAEPVTLTELAERAELDRSTVGRNIRVIERIKLVEVDKGEDQREASVRLSRRGRQILEKGVPIWDSVQSSIEDRLGREGAHALRDLLHAI